MLDRMRHVRRFGTGSLIDRLERRMMLAADLIGAFAGNVPASLPPAGTNKLTFRLSNIGDAAAVGQTRFTLFASSDATLDDADIQLFTFTRSLKLGAGKAQTLKLSFPSSSSLPDGNYFLIARSDDANAIVENDETNNLAVTASPVTIRQPFVDLGGTITGLPKTPVNLGVAHPKPVKGTVVLTNLGNVAAKGPVQIDLYASTTPQLDSNAVGPLSLPAKTFSAKPGKSKAFKGKFTLPSATTPGGDYFIIAVVHPGQGMSDTNLANNTIVSSTTVTILNAGVTLNPSLSGPLAVDTDTFVAGASDQIRLTANVAHTTPAAHVEVDEVDSAGTFIGKVTDLFDNGDALSNDPNANDGVFNNTAAITFDTPGDRFFIATLTDGLGNTLKTPAVKVSGIAQPTDAQYQQAVDDNTTMKQQVTDALAAGQTPAAALAAVKTTLEAHPEMAKPGSIVEAPKSIGWETPEGIWSVVSTPALQGGTERVASQPSTQQPTLAAENAPVPAAPSADATPDACKRALVIAPYAYEFEPDDEGDDIANLLLAHGFTVAVRRNAAASDTEVSLDDFRNLEQYSVIAISSHGDTLPEFGVIYDTHISAGLFARFGNRLDLSTHRLAISDGEFAITPRFISRYSGSLDGTIVYASTCRSTYDFSMSRVFLGSGAGAYIGYSDYVDTTFAYTHGVQTFITLLGDSNNTVGDIPGGNSDTETDTDPAIFEVRAEDMTAKLKTKCALLADYDVFIQYSWPQTQKDLDTTTTFQGASVGYSNDNSSTILEWSGDNTSTGGTETVTADLDKAYHASSFTSETITLNAGWYEPSNGAGPALVTVALKNKISGATRAALQKVITPGHQRGAAGTVVGTIAITISSDADPEVSFMLT